MKKTRVFRTALTLFIRVGVLLTLWILLLAAAVASCIWEIANSGGVGSIPEKNLSLYFSIAAFVLFAFTAYEFCCYGRRYHLIECLRSIPGEQYRLVTAQGLVLFPAVLVFWGDRAPMEFDALHQIPGMAGGLSDTDRLRRRMTNHCRLQRR